MTTKIDKTFFSDLPVSFLPHPVTGDVKPIKNENAVKKAIRNLVLTNHYEKRFKPAYGGNITKMLFELSSTFLAAEIEARLKKVIQFYEPRATVLRVSAQEFERTRELSVTIVFMINNTREVEELTLNLKRDR